MRMTWTSAPVSDEQAFNAIKDGVDAAGGAKVYLNGGEFYGMNVGPANLELLARFYERYPSYVDKTVLCIKGGMKPGSLEPLATKENIRYSVDHINAKLRGTKRLDVFENARVDPARPIEDTISILKKLVGEGKFDHIALSHCGAETLRRANAVHPIVHLEIKVSPFVYDEGIQEVISTAAELNIPILAYSPLGAGDLTAAIRSLEDRPPTNSSNNSDHIKDNVDHKTRIAAVLSKVAKEKGVTPYQLSIAWVLSLGPHMFPVPGSSHSARTLENLAAGDITLTTQELSELTKVITATPTNTLR